MNMDGLAACTCSELPEHVKHSEPVGSNLYEIVKRFPRTWRAEEPRRHWEMVLHCEKAMFPRPTPNLPLPTREAQFYWHLFGATAKHQARYQKELNAAILSELFKMIRRRKLSKELLLSAQLFRLSTFDYLSRRRLIGNLETYLRQQTAVESFCIEGLQLKRDEGLRLMSALFESRKTLMHLYCWRAFAPAEGPPLFVDDSGLCEDQIPRKCEWFRIIGGLEVLTTLSINYAYLATPNGDLLTCLAKRIGAHWEWLQLLCPTEEIPCADKPINSRVVWPIPDISWKQTRMLAPNLKVQFVFVGIPEYEMHKKFFTKHTPVHSFLLSTDIDLKFRQPWHLDCTLKTLTSWYPQTLVFLYLQLWHHREILDADLRKLFPLLPKLRIFEFVGEIRRLETLCEMCCQIREKKCEVKSLRFQLQDSLVDTKSREEWKRDIECLISCFREAFTKLCVTFGASFYPC